MVFGSDLDPSLYLMLKGNKKTALKIRKMISMMPEELLESIRDKYAEVSKSDSGNEYGEGKYTDFHGRDYVSFSYKVEPFEISITTYDSKTGRDKYWFTLSSLGDTSEKSFADSLEIGSFGEVTKATDYSVDVLESEYELLNTPLGCVMIERSEARVDSDRMKTRFYPINYKKFLEAKSIVQDEENQMRLRRE